jgi:succinate dehydrogenase/fumarate reductase flavoprotein subunit
MPIARSFDVVVAGSGAAGLVSALSASIQGAKVLVLERSPLLGGTSAISGGQIWSPLNALMSRAGLPDDANEAITYLSHVTLGQVSAEHLAVYVNRSPSLLEFLERRTDLEFFRVDRPDYHPDFPGARDGRAFEPLPYETTHLGHWASIIRTSPVRSPVTSREAREGVSEADLADRRSRGVRTQGAALVAGLVHACIAQGVTFRTDARLVDVLSSGGRITGCRWVEAGEEHETHAAAGVILASGGFEWNRQLKEAFLSPADDAPTSPPWNEGDGLVIGLRLGAGVAHMGQAWWTAAAMVPGEEWDGKSLIRNIVRELALPGSILVNGSGRRFVNEASSYHDLGKAFQAFDPGRYTFPNKVAWLIFDAGFKERYQVMNVKPSDPAPDWFERGDTLPALAQRLGIEPSALEATLGRFNAQALEGEDRDFGRGADRHGRTYGDPKHMPNPCLGPISSPPYFAIPIHHGNNGTKGGLMTDEEGRVLRFDGSTIPGLFACGNVAASLMGPGYPGTGGSLGPAMTGALFAGRMAAQTMTDMGA